MIISDCFQPPPPQHHGQMGFPRGGPPPVTAGGPPPPMMGPPGGMHNRPPPGFMGYHPPPALSSGPPSFGQVGIRLSLMLVIVPLSDCLATQFQCLSLFLECHVLCHEPECNSGCASSVCAPVASSRSPDARSLPGSAYGTSSATVDAFARQRYGHSSGRSVDVSLHGPRIPFPAYSCTNAQVTCHFE